NAGRLSPRAKAVRPRRTGIPTSPGSGGLRNEFADFAQAHYAVPLSQAKWECQSDADARLSLGVTGAQHCDFSFPAQNFTMAKSEKVALVTGANKGIGFDVAR